MRLPWQIISSCCFHVLSEYSTNPQGDYAELLQKDNYASLKEILLEKQHDRDTKSTLPLVIKFAQYLSISQEPEILVIKNDLDIWIEETIEKLDIDRKTLKQSFKVKPKSKYHSIYSKFNPYLLIIFEPILESVSSPEFEFNLIAELFFQEELNSCQEESKSKAKRVDLTSEQYLQANQQDIWAKIYQLIEEANKFLLFNNNSKELTIELFLPKQYLVNLSPEIQEIPLQETEPPWFGSRYKLVLRSYDRFNTYDYHHCLLEKWNKFSNFIRNTSGTTIKNQMICLSQGYQEND